MIPSSSNTRHRTQSHTKGLVSKPHTAGQRECMLNEFPGLRLLLCGSLARYVSLSPSAVLEICRDSRESLKSSTNAHILVVGSKTCSLWRPCDLALANKPGNRPDQSGRAIWATIRWNKAELLEDITLSLDHESRRSSDENSRPWLCQSHGLCVSRHARAAGPVPKAYHSIDNNAEANKFSLPGCFQDHRRTEELN